MPVITAETIFVRPISWMDHSAAYLSAGKLLHAMTIVELFTILFIATFIGGHPLKPPAIMILFIFILFSQLDARSRFQEYKLVRDQLIEYGPNRRIFKSVANSRCQRDAALAAARKIGYATPCKDYFSVAGYRWHHLLPDVVKRDPRTLLSRAFWRATFFAPGYQSRYSIGRPVTNSIGHTLTKWFGRHGTPGPGLHPLKSDGIAVVDSARYLEAQ